MEIKSTLEKIRPIANRLLGKSMSVLDKTWSDIVIIKKWWDISSFLFKLSYIAYLIYALVAGVGNLYVNIAFLAFSVAYMSFDTMTRLSKSTELKQKKGTIRRRFRIGKILIDTVKLSMAAYGVAVSWKNPSVIGVVLAVFSALVFLFDVVFEIIYTVIMSRYTLLCEAFNQDITNLKSKLFSGKELVGAVATAGRFIIRPSARSAIAGVGYAQRFVASKIDKCAKPQKLDKKQSAVMSKLDKIHTAWLSELAEKRTLQKAQKAQAKLDRAAKKKEAAARKKEAAMRAKHERRQQRLSESSRINKKK